MMSVSQVSLLMPHRKTTRIVRNTFTYLLIIFVTPFCPSVLLSVCLSVRPHDTFRLPTDGLSWNQIWYIRIFRKYVKKINFNINLTRITGSLHEFLYKLMIISSWILLRMRVFRTKFVYKIKAHNFCAIIFSKKSYRLWKNVEKLLEIDRPQMTKKHGTGEMRVSCPITKARIQTHTHNI